MTRFFRPKYRPSELTQKNNASSSKTIRDNLTKFCMQVKRSILHNSIKDLGHPRSTLASEAKIKSLKGSNL